MRHTGRASGVSLSESFPSWFSQPKKHASIVIDLNSQVPSDVTNLQIHLKFLHDTHVLNLTRNK